MNVVCELSGGFDSAVTTILALEGVNNVHGFFVDYGQQYVKQERAAVAYMDSWLREKYGERYKGVRIVSVDLCLVLRDRKDAAAVPEYVPIRNLVIGALAANFAESVGAQVVSVGSKTTEYRPDDPYCFYDCTTKFYRELSSLVNLASQPGVRVSFVQQLVEDGVPMPKWKVLKNLDARGIDLRRLWNCYRTDGEPVPCNSCFHCGLMPADLELAGLAEKYKDTWK